MLKIAVIGAQTLLGRELVQVLEQRDCSVLPLATGALTKNDEEGDVVVFAPEPALLEGLDVAILADAPQNPDLLTEFPGRVLDLRPDAPAEIPPMPLVGSWPEGEHILRGRPAVEQVLAIAPSLVQGIGDLAGTHLSSIASLGDRGLDGLMEQTVAILKGEDPNLEKLGYRAAFEVLPQVSRGNLIEVRVPAFHGDFLILHLKAQAEATLVRKDAPQGVHWVEVPPSSREIAVSSDLLAHFTPSAEGRAGILTLGFDPILWGLLRPLLRVLGL